MPGDGVLTMGSLRTLVELHEGVSGDVPVIVVAPWTVASLDNVVETYFRDGFDRENVTAIAFGLVGGLDACPECGCD